MALVRRLGEERLLSVELERGGGGAGARFVRLASALAYAKLWDRELVLVASTPTDDDTTLVTRDVRRLPPDAPPPDVTLDEHWAWGLAAMPWDVAPHARARHIHLRGNLHAWQPWHEAGVQAEVRAQLLGVRPAAFKDGLSTLLEYARTSAAFVMVRAPPHALHTATTRAGSYYTRALRLLPPEAKLLVLTELADGRVALPLAYTSRIDHIVDVATWPPLVVLHLMAACRYGGVTANDSLSWLGGYLTDGEERQVIIPHTWWPPAAGFLATGLHYPGATILPV
jgi:hypothetical protein